MLLNCKGAPRKPPQQLEWKLVSGVPVVAPHPQESFPKKPDCLGPSSPSPEHRPHRSLEGPVSPGGTLG